ncbi:hypothetical protein EV44_g4106 [Erysiphe necator]|uniref:Uncharacterized protein n=1 Tax=Uncinula necator TaxID=52586 RepID=A0A0B1PD09_UNCNE|nr:hypothetical protein EV44_g4106 [Erysiphe necator]
MNVLQKNTRTRPSRGHAPKPSYAQALTTKQLNFNTVNLPFNQNFPAPAQSSQNRRADNRIFVQLSEAHPSREHHIHAIKTALIQKLGPEGEAVKVISKVKSGMAIVPVDEKHAEKLLEESESIISVLGGKVDKAEEWITYVKNHVPRMLHSLAREEIQIIEASAKKEVEKITSLVPTRISWSKNTLANPGPTGIIVASFNKQT